ncbi:type III-B CRISPR module-associated protein Cmr5 [Sphingobacteriales bacterium UPWRP_1]|nr:type III-B CRISPR module-associated protein Cmr5 [Sphingobacteriales bacterium TSM_CSM]PSJ78855.1 type III-B CRISPR module-associated protein Cmr5 [Sphingobacteriales bacterium UPWRP_1]
MTHIKHIENEIAVKAFKFAEQGKEIYDAAKAKKTAQVGSEEYKDEKYKSYVKKLPAMIQNNGLGVTFAFILSKKAASNKPKNAYDLIYQQISEYLQDDIGSTDLAKHIIAQNSQEYRALTKKVLSLLSWLKRFADGLIDDEPEKNTTEEEGGDDE